MQAHAVPVEDVQAAHARGRDESRHREEARRLGRQFKTWGCSETYPNEKLRRVCYIRTLHFNEVETTIERDRREALTFSATISAERERDRRDEERKQRRRHRRRMHQAPSTKHQEKEEEEEEWITIIVFLLFTDTIVCI